MNYLFIMLFSSMCIIKAGYFLDNRNTPDIYHDQNSGQSFNRANFSESSYDFGSSKDQSHLMPIIIALPLKTDNNNAKK